MTARSGVLDQVQRALGWLLTLLMGVMVLDVTWQVVSRLVLRAPSSFTEELAGFLLIWIGLLGAAYCLRAGSHLGIDLLVARLRGRARRAAMVAAHLLVAAFALSTLVIGGASLVRLALHLHQTSAAMGIPVGFVYLALPLAGLLMLVFSLEAIARTVTAAEAA
jgi:TRAP-type C4-dicarboxylate transport system permease small subunit